jgi:hypothetical protein
MNQIFSLCLVSTVFTTLTARACDLCSAYTASLDDTRHGECAMHAGISGQFTRFGSLRFEGDEVANSADQYLNSSISQLIVGKSFLDDRIVLQANVPLIYRDYRRPEDGTIEEGKESGLGDISLLLRGEIYRYDSSGVVKVDPARDVSVAVNMFSGLKLPTGDSSRIEEELHEHHEEEHEAHEEEHEEEHEDHETEDVPESGIHGHDLALGSGSYDALIGGDVIARSGNWFFEADFQYALRSEGDYSYHYANDLMWSCGPGWYAMREAGRSVAAKFVISGETKDTDRFQGDSAPDTGLTAVYMGPRILGKSGGFDGELGLELPIVIDNTALQIVPDYRIRAAITFRF